jgi:hypothetical protein
LHSPSGHASKRLNAVSIHPTCCDTLMATPCRMQAMTREQAWLGHRNIQHTVRYTDMAPDRFKRFWRD